MTSLRPTVPVSVPAVVERREGFQGDVSAQTISGSSDLDKKPDARLSPPAAGSAAGVQPAGTVPEANLTPNERLALYPSNHTLSEKERKKVEKKFKEQQKKNAKKQPAPADAAPKPAATPAASTTPPPSSSSNQ